MFAAQIGVDRTSALRTTEAASTSQGDAGLNVARINIGRAGKSARVGSRQIAGSDIEPEATTTRNKGLLTPSWQRFKVSDDEYGTPQALFDYYDRIYHFTCDVCATPQLAKCKKFYTPAQDGL